MERILNIEDAKKKIERRIAYYQERIDAWKKVERIRKKDGGDFAILSKNFTNCKIEESYSFKELKVYYKSNLEGYTNDWINISGNQYQEEADTPEKIEKRIAETIERYEGYKTRSEKALATIESTLKAIEPELEKLKSVIKEGETETDTQYIIGAYIKSYLHILND